MNRTLIPDSTIRSNVRSTLVQHRVDMQHVQLRVSGGTVRLSGRICHLGGLERKVSAGTLESLAREITNSRGVRRTFLDFDNWRRAGSGEWQAIRVARETSLQDLDEEVQITLLE